jgi:hypothetical protein
MLVITGGLVHSVSTARGEPRDIVVEGDVIADIVAPGAVRNATGGDDRHDAISREFFHEQISGIGSY